VNNSNGNLVCAAAQAVQLTTQTSAGFTVFKNNCGGNEYIALRTSSGMTGLVIILKPSQSVELGVDVGASQQSACNSPPTDLTHFEYMAISTQP